MFLGLRRRRVETNVAETAVEMFARHGFHGVTAEELAKKTMSRECSLYVQYRDMERLYDLAVHFVINELKSQFSRFARTLVGAETDPKRVAKAVRIWFSALKRLSVVFIVRVLMGEGKERDVVSEELDRFISGLGYALERLKVDRKMDGEVIARMLIHDLLLEKIEAKNHEGEISGILENVLGPFGAA